MSRPLLLMGPVYAQRFQPRVLYCTAPDRFSKGTSLRPDDDASKEVYGRSMTARTIVTGNRISVPASGRHQVDVLEKNAPHNESKRSTL